MCLLLWADQQGGWKVCGSSSGFRFPDGSVLSPDASLIRLDRWQSLTVGERRSFAPCAARCLLIRPMALALAGC